MGLRWWSSRVLARHFTVDVTIHPDHELVRRGPYRLLRHPSYTGLLVTFLGFALCLGNWLSLAAMLPVVLAFLWRIQVEERVLREAFPKRYAAYARETKRLVPYRSEEHTSELQSLMRISYAVLCLKKKNTINI